MANQSKPKNKRVKRVLPNSAKATALSFRSLMNRRQFSGPWTSSFGANIGFPDRLKCLLKYSEVGTFTGSAAPSGQVFQVNSLFDPNLSGTGHQPSYFDTIKAVYGRYCVQGATVEVEIMNGSGVGIFVASLYSDINIGADSVEQMTEARHCKNFSVGINSGMGNARNSLPYMDFRKLMGQPVLESDSNMYTDVGSTPTDVCYWIFKAVAADGSTTMSANWKATIIFDCIFKDLLPQISS